MSLNFTKVVKRLSRFFREGKRRLFFCLLSFFLLQSAQSEAFSDSSDKESPLIISSLEDCKLPQEMISRIKRLSPAEIIDLQEEFQQTSTDDNGEQIVTKVLLKFMHDHIVGSVKEFSLNNNYEAKTNNVQIQVPVQWMCVPKDAEHSQHFSDSVAGLKGEQEEHHCINWIQRDDNVVFQFKDTRRKKRKIF